MGDRYSRRDNGANVAKSSNGESDDLQEEVNEVLVLAIHEVVASTEEEKPRECQFLWQNPAERLLV